MCGRAAGNRHRCRKGREVTNEAHFVSAVTSNAFWSSSSGERTDTVAPQASTDPVCRKVDFLSYANEWLKKVVTGTYLRWIHHFPVTYDKAYRTFASSSSSAVAQHFQWYERFFVKKMQHLLEKEHPISSCVPTDFHSSLRQPAQNAEGVENACHQCVHRLFHQFHLGTPRHRLPLCGRYGIKN